MNEFLNSISVLLGEKGRRIRELTSVVQKRFKFPENSVELYAERVYVPLPKLSRCDTSSWEGLQSEGLDLSTIATYKLL